MVKSPIGIIVHVLSMAKHPWTKTIKYFTHGLPHMGYSCRPEFASLMLMQVCEGNCQIIYNCNTIKQLVKKRQFKHHPLLW